MKSTLGGDDPAHDLPDSEKDKLERKLREEARRLRLRKKMKDSTRKSNRATEISRPKAKRAHQGTD
jgi:hypothetical protein